MAGSWCFNLGLCHSTSCLSSVEISQKPAAVQTMERSDFFWSTVKSTMSRAQSIFCPNLQFPEKNLYSQCGNYQTQSSALRIQWPHTAGNELIQGSHTTEKKNYNNISNNKLWEGEVIWYQCHFNIKGPVFNKKIVRHGKKEESMPHIQEKNQPTENIPEGDSDFELNKQKL